MSCSRASDEQGGIWAKEKEPVRIVLLTVRHVLFHRLLTSCRARSVNGQLISVRSNLLFCEGIPVGLGLPEDGVKRHGNAYERILIRVVLKSWLINAVRIVF
jgi:hypothetical protein